MSTCTARTPAHSLYIGRAFSEVKKVASHLDCPIFVVSAGIGLIKEDETIPPYDLTVSGKHASILPLLTRLQATSADWWRELGKQKGLGVSPIADLVRNNPQKLVLLAVPANYFGLIGQDLSNLNDNEISRLRIFTSPAGARQIPEKIRRAVLPYDDRLETTGRPGTRSDFAQRALAHFVLDLNAVEASLQNGIEAVKTALAQFFPRKVQYRKRCSDEELSALLLEHWHQMDGQSSRLLRFLRDEAVVACEQSRLRRLCSMIRASMDTKGDVR
jgi:hypothetical protein